MLSKYSFIILILLILAGYFGYYYAPNLFQATFPAPTKILKPIDPKVQLTQSELSIKNVRINSLFFGDVFWGRYIDDWSKASELKTKYPFSGLASFDRVKYDAWIADMECPITTTYRDSEAQDNDLKFSCPVEYTSEAAKWFTAFTLANNHTDNMEEVQGLNQTRSNLEKNKVQYFGSFDNSRKKEICEVVTLPSTLELTDGAKQKSLFPIALCGFHNVFKLPKQDELEVISQYSKYFPTIVMPHQGQEYTTTADELQTEYYRKMIDLGADAVIGDHVHSVQNTEAYKGKLIVYSLGNFIFDQQANNGVREAFGANLDFNFKYTDQLKPYLEMAKSCQSFQDECLDIAQKKNLVRPVFDIKYDIVVSDNSNKLTKKANDTNVIDRVKRITNWVSTKDKLENK